MSSRTPIPDPFAPGGPTPERDATPPSSELGGAPAPLSRAAIASVVLALLPCLPFIGGLLGVALGVSARGEIERSGGRRGGSTLATVGIALGAAHLMLSVAAFGGFIAYLARPGDGASDPGPSPITLPPPPPPALTAPTPTTAPTRPSGPPLVADAGVTVTRVGRITVVDIGRASGGLGMQLQRQRGLAQADGHRLLVWLVLPNCEPCDGVAKSLPDPRMQRALDQVRLVRLNVREFRIELKDLDVPVDAVPGFVLLGDSNLPVDFVHGGEWDADIAANIAPVLSKFVRGTYANRRHPWRGGQRDDETPI